MWVWRNHKMERNVERNCSLVKLKAYLYRHTQTQPWSAWLPAASSLCPEWMANSMTKSEWVLGEGPGALSLSPEWVVGEGSGVLHPSHSAGSSPPLMFRFKNWNFHIAEFWGPSPFPPWIRERVFRDPKIHFFLCVKQVGWAGKPIEMIYSGNLLISDRSWVLVNVFWEVQGNQNAQSKDPSLRG